MAIQIGNDIILSIRGTPWSGKQTSNNTNWRTELRYCPVLFNVFFSAAVVFYFFGWNFLSNIQSSTSHTIENELFHLLTQKVLITNYIVSPSSGTWFKKGALFFPGFLFPLLGGFFSPAPSLHHEASKQGKPARQGRQASEQASRQVSK